MTTFDKEKTRQVLADLRERGLYIGTSSWKYSGWLGTLYDESKYLWREKFAQSRFEKNCLAEYSEVFSSVCVDAAYYTFPKEDYLKGLAEQVPSHFQFGFKVTDAITLKTFPALPRFGTRGGSENESFLDPARFIDSFLAPCESIRSKVGILIFEFSRFHARDFNSGREFLDKLDTFLSKLPVGWPYGIELRNRSWLTPVYFDCLKRHGVIRMVKKDRVRSKRYQS